MGEKTAERDGLIATVERLRATGYQDRWLFTRE